jgi:dienelactone hydrolase
MEAPEWTAYRARVSRFPEYIEDVKKTAQWLRSLGATSVGIVGLCWGGKVAALSSTVNGLVNASAGVHPSRLEREDAECACGPVCMVMSQGEPPHEDLQAIYASNQWANKNVFVRFDDLAHGFMGARGPGVLSADPKDAVGKRIIEAFDIVVKFFSDNLC